MRWIALAGVIAVAALAAGCGSDDSDSETANAQTDSATAAEGEAMKGDDEAMKADDEAMKKDGEAMKGEDAMKAEGHAMKGEPAATVATIEVVESQYGSVIADGNGEALYLFDKEGGPSSGDPKAGSGAKAGLLGSTERKDGELQVTYDGHPLYYYVDDSPGTILCQNVDEFGGLWLVVQPDGEAVT
jgi:predicted lipoprotein with Yx(FWY)xxD motif